MDGKRNVTASGAVRADASPGDGGELLENDVPLGIRIPRVVCERIERDDDHGRSTDILKCVHHTRRKDEAPHFIGGHVHCRELTIVAIAHTCRPKDRGNLRAGVMKMIASDLARLGQYDMHIALAAKSQRIQGLEHLTACVDRTPEFFDRDGHACSL